MELLMNTTLHDYPSIKKGVYYTCDIRELTDDDMENEDLDFSAMGTGDFHLFDLLLLFIIPIDSSITIKACIAFGCIISVQIGNLCTNYMFYYTDTGPLPALPFPVIVVTAYTIVLDAIIQYSNHACENPYHHYDL
jgi:hypothetical protein